MLLRFVFANLQLCAAIAAELAFFRYHGTTLGAVTLQHRQFFLQLFFFHRSRRSLQHFNLLLQFFDAGIGSGDAFAQGVFVEYGITLDDDADGVRTGGFGSTGK